MAENLDAKFRRLLLLVPFVMERQGIRVEEVCSHFGINRSQLIADLQLLFVCGLPTYGPGDLIEAFVDGDEVYIRMADYFAKPLRLTAPEALLLYAGARALSAAGVGDDSLERALKRLEEVLGPETLQRVNIELEGTEDLAKIRRALSGSLRIRMTYYAQSKDETTERDVDPWALFASAGRWYLVGWCNRVSDERIFRLDRIKTIEILEEHATVPEDVDLSKYEGLYVEGAGATQVVLELAGHVAAWVADYYPLESQEALDDGWVRVRLSAGGLAWIERLLLQLGPQARVVEPQELALSVKRLACKLADLYRRGS